MLAVILLSATLAATPASAGPTRLTLKNGTTYSLKAPPRISGGRIVFETVDGKMFSIAESEVATIGSPPQPTATPRYNPQDSRALGGIARQQRQGRPSEVAPRPAPAARRKAARAKRPRVSPTPLPR
jgi:hypothetical protein